MFDHYLITRFNLRNPKWDVTKNKESLLTNDWMDDRMWLFENFCFPSVTAQTNKNFTWLLYFDTSTEEIYRTRISNLIEKFANVKVFYIKGMPEFYTSIQQYIKSQPTSKSHLITSRIDNDDCIHRNFIEEVQNKFDRQDYVAIDVIKGYSLQIKPTFMLGKKEHLFNPFISLIEKNVDPKTVWSNDHTQWKKESNIIQIRDKRLWMSIIHHKNKVNEFDGYDAVSWLDINSDFVLSAEMDKTIQSQLIPHSEWKYLSFKNKMHVNFGRYFKALKRKLGLYKLK